jgi:hypothetical protein
MLGGKLIGQPADSLAVRLVALARLKMDALEVQLLAGDPTVSLADIATLQETFDKYVPKPKIEVKLTIVEPADKATADHAAVDGLVECRRCQMRVANDEIRAVKGTVTNP